MRLKVLQKGWIRLPPEWLEKQGIQAGDMIEVNVSLAEKLGSFRHGAQAEETFRLQCFGQFALYKGSEYIPIRSKKARELLALLVLEAAGKPVSKRYIASMLWPESSMTHARDCLYKTLSWFRTRPELCELFGLKIYRESISVRTDALSIDLTEFEHCYARRDDIDCCERALELYNGPLLWQNCYDWTSERQSWYEIRYDELLNALAVCHQRERTRNREAVKSAQKSQ